MGGEGLDRIGSVTDKPLRPAWTRGKEMYWSDLPAGPDYFQRV